MALGKNFRLPRAVLPHLYRAELSIDLGHDSFSGKMEVAIEIAAPTDRIHLHAIDLTLTEAVVRAGATRVTPKALTTDPESQTVTWELPAPLAVGESVLEITWHGKFCPGLRGLYRAGKMAVTQFEAADARRLFPCFDEPSFKAIWDLRLVDVPPGVVTLSNGGVLEDQAGADGRRRVRFAPTPVMSSYLVAVILGELAGSDPMTVRGIPLRTWAVPTKRALTGFAQEAAAAVIPMLEDYFGLPYAFGKVDQIGIPDFESGAMENSGCITFREVALLLDPATAPLGMLKRVAEVVTHELAHQWFGNLVTMVWWDDLWLNEAFATWMAYKIVDQWKPGWRVWMDFEVGKGAAMVLDSLRSAHPIRADINNAEEAGESFDAITYEKGGAVLRMIEGYLGADRFRDGIRLYMKRHQSKNAVADDLWGALGEASGEPILELANAWIRQVGYPMVSFSLVGGGDSSATVSVSQQRYFSDPQARENGNATRWPVPLVLRYRDDEGIKELRHLLHEGEAEVVLPVKGGLRWCVGNAGGAGFYRCRYDNQLSSRLRASVQELAPAERLNLVSDLWSVVRIGAAPVAGFLDLVVAMANERDHNVLDELVTRLAVLEHRYVTDAERPLLERLVAKLFDATAHEMGWGGAGSGEDDDTRLRRAAILRAVIGIGRVPSLIAEAEHRFAAYVTSRSGGVAKASGLDANLLDVVVMAAARTADAARFDELIDLARIELDPAAKRRYLHALAKVETPALIERAVQLCLTETVPMQDFTSYLATLLGNRATRESAWRLVRDRWADVRAKAESPFLLRRLIESLGSLPERRHLEEVEALLAKHPIEAVRQATAQTLERMRTDLAVRERLLPDVSAYLASVRG